jgi:hypothetical protein
MPSAEYYAAHKKELNKKYKEYREANLGHLKLRAKKYRKKNLKQLLVRSKQYYYIHKTEWADKNKNWRLNNHSLFRAQKERYKLKHPEVILAVHARERAKRFGWSCSISSSKIYIPTYCPDLTWIKLERGVRESCDNSPSLDRIDSDPTIGYIDGNYRVISMLANRLKGKKSMLVWKPITEAMSFCAEVNLI